MLLKIIFKYISIFIKRISAPINRKYAPESYWTITSLSLTKFYKDICKFSPITHDLSRFQITQLFYLLSFKSGHFVIWEYPMCLFPVYPYIFHSLYTNNWHADHRRWKSLFFCNLYFQIWNCGMIFNYLSILPNIIICVITDIMENRVLMPAYSSSKKGTLFEKLWIIVWSF